MVSQWLHQNAIAFFDPDNVEGLPLICMGPSDLSPPGMPDDHVCESWLGPLGEQIYWIRPQDERLYWLTGGNPRTAKEVETRAYFFFSKRSEKNPKLTWLSFRDAFKKQRVKKMLCTSILGADPQDIGFVRPDDLGEQQIEYFHHHCKDGATRHIRQSMYIHFDLRFLAKIAIGVGFNLFGRKALETEYSDQLHKALWHRSGEQLPSLRGATAFSQERDPRFTRFTGQEYAVTVAVVPSAAGVVLNLNIGAHGTWTIMCASLEGLSTKDMELIKEGRVMVLYRWLQKGFALPMHEFIAHRAGSVLHSELDELTRRGDAGLEYFRSL